MSGMLLDRYFMEVVQGDMRGSIVLYEDEQHTVWAWDSATASWCFGDFFPDNGVRRLEPANFGAILNAGFQDEIGGIAITFDKEEVGRPGLRVDFRENS